MSFGGNEIFQTGRIAKLEQALAAAQQAQRDAEAALQRAREALHEYHNADRGRWGQVWVPATRCHNEECRRAALEATQPREAN